MQLTDPTYVGASFLTLCQKLKFSFVHERLRLKSISKELKLSYRLAEKAHVDKMAEIKEKVDKKMKAEKEAKEEEEKIDWKDYTER